jgi:hypothetical protein
VRQQLKALLKAVAAQQAESSASRQRSAHDGRAVPSVHHQNPSPLWHRGHEGGARGGASAVKSHLEANCNVRNTIKAHRWATSVDNYGNDNNRDRRDEHRSGRHDSRGHAERNILRTMCGSRTGGWSLPCVMSD